MNVIRTTLRLNEDIKVRAEHLAIEENRTLQDIFNDALQRYIEEKGKKKAKKIYFISHDLGTPLDNLTRDTYYD